MYLASRGCRSLGRETSARPPISRTLKFEPVTLLAKNGKFFCRVLNVFSTEVSEVADVTIEVLFASRVPVPDLFNILLGNNWRVTDTSQVFQVFSPRFLESFDFTGWSGNSQFSGRTRVCGLLQATSERECARTGLPVFMACGKIQFSQGLSDFRGWFHLMRRFWLCLSNCFHNILLSYHSNNGNNRMRV